MWQNTHIHKPIHVCRYKIYIVNVIDCDLRPGPRLGLGRLGSGSGAGCSKGAAPGLEAQQGAAEAQKGV